MIKLNRPAKPEYLTQDKEEELTQKFASDGSSVWKRRQITKPLLESSSKKCAYCECQLQEADSYMEVEHFFHKDEYGDQVVQWSNLLPSCKRCNVAKGTHDVGVDPIVDPYTMEPNDYLYLYNSFLKHRDQIGFSTIEALDLNNIDRLATPRFKISAQIEDNFTAIENALDMYREDNTPRRRNKLTSKLKGTLKQCQKDTAYAATAATFLHGNDAYHRICTAVRDENLWDEELQSLHDASEAICLTR